MSITGHKEIIVLEVYVRDTNKTSLAKSAIAKRQSKK